MSNLAYSIIYPQPRKLTLGLVLALSLFTLTVNAQTVVRTGTGGAVSGNDIGEVQNAPGAAEGDVIKVSDGAVFNTQVTDPVSGFTVESATGNVVNVPVQAWYNFPQIPAAPVNATFRNVSFTSADSYTSSFWREDYDENNIFSITIDGKVSFSNFKDSVFDYTKSIITNGCPYRFTCTSGSSLTFSGNTTAERGAAIVQLSELNGNSSFMTFSDNTAKGNGGAIYKLKNLTGENNKLTFSNNTANGTGYLDGGGAIYYLLNFSGSGNILDFTGNTANYGGAIWELRNLSGSGNTLDFSENTAATCGGAIHQLTSLSGSGNNLEFTGNTANYGGAISILSKLSGNNNTLTFTGNSAEHGGAIDHLNNLSGSGNTLTFTGNTANQGGAIFSIYDLSGSSNTLLFEDNTAITNGGAIFQLGNSGGTLGLTGNNNKLTFTGNSAGEYGGAIYSHYPITFSGNNTLTFTGNKAGEKGNDIYLYDLFGKYDLSGSRPANLTFSGGTYSFDGGIWLADETASTTISNGAKVTIAGRNDDSVNEYEFGDVALNANLTATVDDIEYLHGNFTVGENGLLTIHKNQKTATIKSSTNYGVFDLLINKAENVETISISSGRIDIQGYLDGTVEVIDGATYSPGNSVGFTNVTGDVIIENGVILFEFGEYPDSDSNHDVLTVIDGSFSIESGLVNLLFENSDVSLWATEGAEYLLVSDDGFASKTIDLTRFLGNYHGYFSLEGRTDGLYLVGLGTPVPEPSTWALLILGAAGLAYMRKRSRQ